MAVSDIHDFAVMHSMKLNPAKCKEMLINFMNEPNFLLNNKNLNETCLNGSHLHLNPKGSAYLATNFIGFIKGDNIRSSMPSRRDGSFRIPAPHQLHLLEDLLRVMTMQGRIN
jgi:hypothetical protein